MRKEYGLAVALPYGLKALNLPPMTLQQAESWRDIVYVEGKGFPVLVVNLETVKGIDK